MGGMGKALGMGEGSRSLESLVSCRPRVSGMANFGRSSPRLLPPSTLKFSGIGRCEGWCEFLLEDVGWSPLDLLFDLRWFAGVVTALEGFPGRSECNALPMGKAGEASDLFSNLSKSCVGRKALSWVAMEGSLAVFTTPADKGCCLMVPTGREFGEAISSCIFEAERRLILL